MKNNKFYRIEKENHSRFKLEKLLVNKRDLYLSIVRNVFVILVSDSQFLYCHY